MIVRDAETIKPERTKGIYRTIVWIDTFASISALENLLGTRFGQIRLQFNGVPGENLREGTSGAGYAKDESVLPGRSGEDGGQAWADAAFSNSLGVKLLSNRQRQRLLLPGGAVLRMGAGG